MKVRLGALCLCVALLPCASIFAGNPSATKTESSMKGTAQAQFDALVVKIARAGIDDPKKVERILHTILLPVGAGQTRETASLLEAKDVPGKMQIVSVNYDRQFEAIAAGEPAHVATAMLSISFSDSSRLSAEHLRTVYEDTVYSLPPNYRDIAYFVLNNICVYLKYSDPARSGSEESDAVPNVSEVLFVWNDQNIRPNFPVLFERPLTSFRKKEASAPQSGIR